MLVLPGHKFYSKTTPFLYSDGNKYCLILNFELMIGALFAGIALFSGVSTEV